MVFADGRGNVGKLEHDLLQTAVTLVVICVHFRANKKGNVQTCNLLRFADKFVDLRISQTKAGNQTDKI